MAKKPVRPERGPQAQGPYSAAIVHGDLVFVSGMGPVDPDTGEIMRGGLEEQMRIAVENIRLVLEAAGSGLEKVLKTTVYLADMDDFTRMNELYRTLFGPVYPARTTIQAARLPLDIRIEIEVIAGL